MLQTLIALGFSFFYLCAHADEVSDFQEKYKNFSIVNSCQIRSFSGSFQETAPGDMCVFLEDGSIIAGNTKALMKILPDESIKWSIPGNYHHEFKLSRDGKHVLVMTTEFNQNLGLTEHFFLKVDFDGHVVHKQGLYDLLLQKFPGRPDLAKAEMKISHYNSLAEIPRLRSPSRLSWMKEGNILLNGYSTGYLVVSPDFSKLLEWDKFSFSLDHSIHDLQMNENGHLFFFNNDNDLTNRVKYSSVQEYDPVKKKLVFDFTPLPKGSFYSERCGGVQDLDGRYLLITHMTQGAMVYDRQSKKIVFTVPVSVVSGHLRLMVVQQMYLQDMNHFLKIRHTERRLLNREASKN